jgi:DNA primase
MSRTKARPSRARFDLDAIRHANPLPDLAANLTVLKQRGSEWIGCCPFHQDRTPSFTIWRAQGKHWQAHCFGCGWHGDVLDLVCQAYGLSLPDAARRLAASDMPDRPDQRPHLSTEINISHQHAARSIWEKAHSIQGTAAETYLSKRGLAPPWPIDLRFDHLRHPEAGRLPCLIAGIRDWQGTLVAVQRIFLAPDGQGKAPVAQPKMSLGPIKGASIHLQEPAGDHLVICEGPEDGLSLMAMLGLPVWVSAGATNLAALKFPPGVRSIVIGADNDATGHRQARLAGQAYAAQGIAVRILYPHAGFKDFNEEWRANGHGLAA